MIRQGWKQVGGEEFETPFLSVETLQDTREFLYRIQEDRIMTQTQWDASSPLAKLLASRKFLLMVMDVVISLGLYFGGKYADPSAVEDLKVVIGLLQPVFVTLIYSIAKEDSAISLAEAQSKATEIVRLTK